MQEISNEQLEFICHEYEYANNWILQVWRRSWYSRFMRWRNDRRLQRYLGYLEIKRIEKEKIDRMYQVLKREVERS